jgi:hypothetical protein
MPSLRTVTGLLRAPTGEPLVGARVVFDLQGLGLELESGAIIATGSFTVTTGADGTFTTALWPNSRGYAPTSYSCRLPTGEAFTFALPEGDGSPLTLSDLRELPA